MPSFIVEEFMHFGIIAGILSQAFCGLMILFSLQSKGVSEELGLLAGFGMFSFILMLFFGSMHKAKTRLK